MASWDEEIPVREELPLPPEEFPQPRPETEYRLPEAGAEDSSPSGGEHENPDPAQEFTPPGSGRAEVPAPPAKKRRRLRRLLYGVAALVLTGLLFSETAERELAPVVAVTVPPTEPPVYTSGSDIPLPVLAPTPEPTSEPLGKEPVIDVDFFYFSHEHHAFVHMSNIDALHSVRVTVREVMLDKQVYEYYLDEDEIASGLFELPMLSTGDFYEENMSDYQTNGSWPHFELTLDAWYENEAGDGEDRMTLTLEPEYEMGIGVSYWRKDYTWDDQIPPDSFVITPWEETDQIRFVVNDPEAVVDPTVFSVDISYGGRHADPDEYQDIIYRDEYDVTYSQTGEREHVVTYTSRLVLKRPDWMPESGTVHVTIVQRLASTGELWVRDFDYEYPPHYDWED